MNYCCQQDTCHTAEEVHATAIESLRGQKNIAVVAGHYMLMYDDLADALVPMVYQDSRNPRVVVLSKQMAGEFPLSSFEHGLRLTSTLWSKTLYGASGSWLMTTCSRPTGGGLKISLMTPVLLSCGARIIGLSSQSLLRMLLP